MAIALQAIKAEETNPQDGDEIDKGIYLAIYLVVGIIAFLLLAYYSYELYVERKYQIVTHEAKVEKLGELELQKVEGVQNQEGAPTSARALIGEETNRTQVSEVQQKPELWPQGVPLDKEKNFWKLMIVLVGLMLTHIGYTMTQNFAGRFTRLSLGTSLGFVSQAMVYFSFAFALTLLGPAISWLYNKHPVFILGGGAIFRLIWQIGLLRAAVHHQDVFINKGDTDIHTDHNIFLNICGGAVTTGLFYGATFVGLLQYIDQCTFCIESESGVRRMRTFVFVMFNIAIILGNFFGALINQVVVDQYVTYFITVVGFGGAGMMILFATQRITETAKDENGNLLPLPKMPYWTSVEIWDQFKQKNMFFLAVTLLQQLAFCFNFYSNLFIIYSASLLKTTNETEGYINVNGFASLFLLSVGTLIGSLYVGKFQERYGDKFTVMLLFFMSMLVMLVMFIHNGFHVFSSLGFVFAFVMGLYDGLLAGYTWYVIDTYFEDRFIALTTAAIIFNFHMGMFTGSSIEIVDYIYFMRYFIATTVFAMQSCIGFYCHFKFEKPQQKEEEVDNLKDLKKRVSEVNVKNTGDLQVPKEADKQDSIEESGNIGEGLVDENQAEVDGAASDGGGQGVQAHKERGQGSLVGDEQMVFPSQVAGIRKSPLGSRVVSQRGSEKSGVSAGAITSMVYASKGLKEVGGPIKVDDADAKPIFNQGTLSIRTCLARKPVGERRTAAINNQKELQEIKEKVLLVMFNGEEEQSLQEHLNSTYTENSFTMTNKDNILANPKNFDFIIVDLFAVSDDDIEANMDYYQHYAKTANTIIWLVHSDDDELKDWCSGLNQSSHFIEIGDEVNVELSEIIEAVQYGQKLNAPTSVKSAQSQKNEEVEVKSAASSKKDQKSDKQQSESNSRTSQRQGSQKAQDDDNQSQTKPQQLDIEVEQVEETEAETQRQENNEDAKEAEAEKQEENKEQAKPAEQEAASSNAATAQPSVSPKAAAAPTNATTAPVASVSPTASALPASAAASSSLAVNAGADEPGQLARPSAMIDPDDLAGL